VLSASPGETQTLGRLEGSFRVTNHSGPVIKVLAQRCDAIDRNVDEHSATGRGALVASPSRW